MQLKFSFYFNDVTPIILIFPFICLRYSNDKTSKSSQAPCPAVGAEVGTEGSDTPTTGASQDYHLAARIESFSIKNNLLGLKLTHSVHVNKRGIRSDISMNIS